MSLRKVSVLAYTSNVNQLNVNMQEEFRTCAFTLKNRVPEG